MGVVIVDQKHTLGGSTCPTATASSIPFSRPCRQSIRDGHKFVAIGGGGDAAVLSALAAARLALRCRDRMDRLFLPRSAARHAVAPGLVISAADGKISRCRKSDAAGRTRHRA